MNESEYSNQLSNYKNVPVSALDHGYAPEKLAREIQDLLQEIHVEAARLGERVDWTTLDLYTHDLEVTSMDRGVRPFALQLIAHVYTKPVH